MVLNLSVFTSGLFSNLCLFVFFFVMLSRSNYIINGLLHIHWPFNYKILIRDSLAKELFKDLMCFYNGISTYTPKIRGKRSNIDRRGEKWQALRRHDVIRLFPTKNVLSIRFIKVHMYILITCVRARELVFAIYLS